MDWNEHFTYDPTIPEGLRWKTFADNRKILPCTPCGYYVRKEKDEVSPKGYYRTTLGASSYANHRIIWEMFNRKLQDFEQIDHFDGNTSNNEISNLRVVSNQDNCYNQRMRENNTSGTTGVYLTTKNKNKNLYWTAGWMENGKKINKQFSVLLYGYDEAFEMAKETRENAIDILRKSGINITERHGNA